MKQIRYFSAKDFKNFMKSFGYVSYSNNRKNIDKIKDENFAIISISNTEIEDNADNEYDLWANGPTNHWMPSTPNVLNLEFDDIDGHDNNYKSAFNNKDAERVIDFIIRNKDKNNFYIHCGAGISRSGAIALFIGDMFKYFGNDYNILPNIPKTPNAWVLKVLHNKINQIEL
jgi:predicted protein tyrosine phosphatase